MRLRIATFNLENLDDKPSQKPTLKERISVMRPQLQRINADILCLQEVNGQEEEGQPRSLLALKKLLEGTQYAGFDIRSTTVEDKSQVYDERNLIILSRYEILEDYQYKHKYASAPLYRIITAITNEGEEPVAKKITWERPILHVKIKVGEHVMHIINLHLKSKIPTDIKGQQNYSKKFYKDYWKTASGWAEGFYISSMKRVGQALETRILIDKLFDEDENALIVVCGDFNSDFDDVPVEAILGRVENTCNEKLAKRVMVPCEMSIPESIRFSLYHQGKENMLDHLLVSRNLLEYYKGSEVHNELLHDKSIQFPIEIKFPESDHAPVVAEFEFPDDD